MKNVSDFLESNGLRLDNYELPLLTGGFLADMEAGLRGGKSSLLMIPAYAYLQEKAPAEQKVAVIDAGGTNLRTALAVFGKDGRCAIEDFKKYAMPGSNSVLSKKEFLFAIASLVEPLMKHTDALAISFAHATEILPDGDGRIIKLSKELDVKGIEGSLLGAELSSVLAQMGYPGKRVYVTNDTVATALSGIAEGKYKDVTSFIGVICGTGTNVCYPETVGSIQKLNRPHDNRRMMVNLESGNFDKIPRSRIDLEFDQSTIDPNFHVLEKMVSGKYLGAISGYILYGAYKQGLFTRAQLPDWEKDLLPTAEVSAFMEGREDSGLRAVFSDEKDRTAAQELLKFTVARAAKLVSLEICATVIKCTRRGETALAVIEGSTYYGLPGFKAQVEEEIRRYLDENHGIHMRFASVDDAVLKGTAMIAVQS